MEEPIYFKCKFDNMMGVTPASGEDTWYSFLKKLQKTWPTDKPIIFNEGTNNECQVEYLCSSRIDANPIFKLVKGERKNIEFGASWCINGYTFESKDIVFIKTVAQY